MRLLYKLSSALKISLVQDNHGFFRETHSSKKQVRPNVSVCLSFLQRIIFYLEGVTYH